MGQISHQDPAWPTLSLTPSVSQFHLNVWSRGIFQNMNQTVPLPCLKPHGSWEKVQAPHLGHLSFLTRVSVAPASASSHVLFHPRGEPCPTCARGQPFSWAGFNSKTWVSTSSPRPFQSCHPVLLSPMHTCVVLPPGAPQCPPALALPDVC